MAAEVAPPRPRRFTPSATHQIVRPVDKFHLALAWHALGLRREQQLELRAEQAESADANSAGRT